MSDGVRFALQDSVGGGGGFGDDGRAASLAGSVCDPFEQLMKAQRWADHGRALLPAFEHRRLGRQ